MKRVLIISPSFPPVNAADMHRVRQSLPYLREAGWDATVLAVEPDLTEGYRDEHLLETVPDDADVRHVGALDYHWTRKFGLGSLALRSLLHFRAAGDRLLASGEYDLVYFSTTMFPVLVLGTYWKRRWGTPYVIDMQDPWYSDYYLTRPKDERPPKFWLSYRLDRLLEPVAMRSVDGLISVSEAYCKMLKERYPHVRDIPCEEIPFGGPAEDFNVLDRVEGELSNRYFSPEDEYTNVVYVGRGGYDMAVSAHGVFGALARGLEERPELFSRVRMHLVGTHYAPEGEGIKTLEPIAHEYGLQGRVFEYPDRVSYFTALHLLRQADQVVIPGSEQAAYTASKLYPYILSNRPLLAIFNEASSVVRIMRQTQAGSAVTFRTGTRPGDEALASEVYRAWVAMLERMPFTPETNWAAFEPYTARAMAHRQVEVFERVVRGEG